MNHKILQIGADNFGKGGRSIVAFNLVKNISKNLQIDFLATTEYKESKVTKKIKKKGNIFKITQKVFINLITLVKSEKYDIVHIHVDQAYEALKLTLAARIGGCKKIIIHAHSSGPIIKYNTLQKVAISISRIIISSLNIVKIAVSKSSAEYMFGKNAKKVVILKDGIDINKYRFSNSLRDKLKKKYNIKNEYVIGNVGRISNEKNQLFLIKVFEYYLENNKNSKLIFVGDGKDRGKIEAEVKLMGLKDKVIFLGYCDNVSEILQMLDVFVFPSKHEGFGMAALEAQACGIPTIISKGVPNEVMVTGICKKVNNWGINNWASAIQEMNGKNINRAKISQCCQSKICKDGYDITKSSRKLESIYRTIIRNIN